MKRISKPTKVASVFGVSKTATRFAKAYSRGEIPCHIEHFGSGRNRIAWKVEPALLKYDNLVTLCVEGLAETSHPYNFVAKVALKELLESPEAQEKILPFLPDVIRAFRVVLNSKDKSVFPVALESLQLLSRVMRHHMDEHLAVLVIPIHRKAFSKASKELVFDTLLALEENGGEKAYAIIKKKIPAYTGIGATI